jgi:protease I
MSEELRGKKIAILIANGFEQSEMTDPKKALETAGAKVEIVSPESGKVRGWKHSEWGDEFDVDRPLEKANVDEYDALLLPGGVMNPDKLRMLPPAVNFVKKFYVADKPIAAICHGPWILIDAGVIASRKLTSWSSIKLDLQNAGAEWVDSQVVRDGKLVTSRKPDDIPAFNKEIIALFSE